MKSNANEDVAQPPKPEDLAAAIDRISESMLRLTRSGMNHKAIVVLIQDDTRIAKRTIETVLSSLGNLKSIYTVPKK